MPDSFVFEDVPVFAGWTATIAVTRDDDETWVAAWMAVRNDGKRYCTRIRRHNASIDDHHAIDDACDLWLEHLMAETSVESAHAEQLRRIRGQRALHAAVTAAPIDGAIHGQTRELLERSMATWNPSHPLRTGDPFSSTNADSIDGDWMDETVPEDEC